MTNFKNNNGFVALMSAIVIAILLLSITLTLSFTGFFARFNVLDTEYKKLSVSLAEACADTALLKFSQDSAYIGGETIEVGDYECTITSVEEDEPVSGQVTILTTASFPTSTPQKAVTNLEVVASESTFDIISWEEVPD